MFWNTERKKRMTVGTAHPDCMHTEQVWLDVGCDLNAGWQMAFALKFTEKIKLWFCVLYEIYFMKHISIYPLCYLLVIW